jgi:hypothetical protein
MSSLLQVSLFVISSLIFPCHHINQPLFINDNYFRRWYSRYYPRFLYKSRPKYPPASPLNLVGQIGHVGHAWCSRLLAVYQTTFFEFHFVLILIVLGGQNLFHPTTNLIKFQSFTNVSSSMLPIFVASVPCLTSWWECYIFHKSW